jgi:hypothetical protein
MKIEVQHRVMELQRKRKSESAAQEEAEREEGAAALQK